MSTDQGSIIDDGIKLGLLMLESQFDTYNIKGHRIQTMGKIIEFLGKVEFKDNPCEYMDIEFNEGKSVHLQSNCWRIELTDQEFREFAKSVGYAAEKLMKIKKTRKWNYER